MEGNNSLFSIASMLKLVGCYYQQQVNASDYDFKENDQMKIIKKGSTVYVAEPYEYQLREDTYLLLRNRHWIIILSRKSGYRTVALRQAA